MLAQDGLIAGTPNRDPAAEVERIAHEVLAGTDLDDASAETSHIIDGRLKDPVVRTDQIGLAQTDGDTDCREGMEWVLGVFAAGLIGLERSGQNDPAQERQGASKKGGNHGDTLLETRPDGQRNRALDDFRMGFSGGLRA